MQIVKSRLVMQAALLSEGEKASGVRCKGLGCEATAES